MPVTTFLRMRPQDFFTAVPACGRTEVFTPLMLDGTYLSRNYATLGPSETVLKVAYFLSKTYGPSTNKGK
jgi:hypothetical protein